MKKLVAIVVSGLLVAAGLAVLYFAGRESGFSLETGGGGGHLASIDESLLPNSAGSANATGGGAAAGENRLPASHLLQVPAILQLPELPNGCEATSLAMVLQYYGYSATKEDIAFTYMPRQDFETIDGVLYGSDPEKAYPGNPTEVGYYCYPGVAARASNRYLSTQYAPGQRAAVLNGLSAATIMQYISQNQPLLLWVTIDGQELYPADNFSWVIAATGEEYAPYTNMHVVVVCGYDEENFILRDPLGEMQTMPHASLMSTYQAAGGHALVIRSTS